ncbi:MAG: shikimate dehydrogenase [Gammaproteobacteria bacterium WSBS_2016_MAG_OTU1]
MNTTQKYGVVGSPVRHSLSPWIHAYFARRTQRNIVYAAFSPPAASFDDFIHDFFNNGGCGLNITVPYKKEALNIAKTATNFAHRADAANVLTIKNGDIHAYNTDGAGLIKDLTINCGVVISDKRVLIAGAGGAARAAAVALAEHTSNLVIAARKLVAAEELASAINGKAVELASCDGDYDIIINATSSGLAGDESPLPPQIFTGVELAYDLNYGKAAASFLSLAATAKNRADGCGMLVEQAALSFAIWQGVLPATQELVNFMRR